MISLFVKVTVLFIAGGIVAALLHRLLTDEAWLARVLAAQEAALDRLEAQDFAATLLGFVEQVLAALRTDGLQRLAAEYGDIDYPSRVLLRLARSVPALAMLGSITVRRPAAAWNLVRAQLPFGF